MSELPRLQYLTDLIGDSRTAATIAGAMRIAAAIQHQRRLDGLSKRKGITRSALLISLMHVDPEVDYALEDIGLSPLELGAHLELPSSPPVTEPSDTYLEPELAQAIRDYMRAVPARAVVGTVDLAAAILVSAESGVRGQLPGRLRRLGVDFPAVRNALRQLGAHGLINPRQTALSDTPKPRDHRTGTEQVLGKVNGVECVAVVTSRPWQLDADAIVVSAAPHGGLGTLGSAVRNNVKGVAWPVEDTYSLTPDLPQVLTVSESKDATHLRLVILASARETNASLSRQSSDGPGTPSAASRGMAAAVTTAMKRGVTSLAVPLLGAGAIGLPLETMAVINVRAVRKSLRRQASPLQRVTFFGMDQETIDAIQIAWTESEMDEAADMQPRSSTSELVEPADPNAIVGHISETTLLAGGISRDLVDAEERIPLEEDHLGVGTYVAMLATLITGRDTPLPLSIGLFGEWGSGKSYFMGLLRGQVHKLAQSGDDSYVREVVPITFNAWHYSDTNLWASLGNEIFEQLAGRPDTPEKHREALREELSNTLGHSKALKDANEQAAQETAQLRRKLEQAQREAAGSATALVSSVANSPTLGFMLKKVWSKLGIENEADQIQLLTGEIRGATTELSALRLATTGRKGLAAVAVAALALVVMAASIFFQDDVASWIAGGGLGAFAVVLATMSLWVQRAREGLRSLHSLADEVRQEGEKATNTKVALELQQLRDADAREAVLQSQLTEVLERAGELGLELAALSPEQRWYDFVSERAGSDDYSSKLGLISTIRKDFERLIELMKDWRTRGEPEKYPPIDRIVLYIDDLDRCSPRQVVDVLQAVHLLLALDLFVVVVGVDPRWLLHSLREQYASVFPDGMDGSLGALVRPNAEADWRTTPQDYLEKIFNIPFVLPGMTGTSFERLIRELSGNPDEQSSDASSQLNVTAKEPSVVSDDSTSSISPGSVLDQEIDLPAETGSEVASALGDGAKPAARRLTEDELNMLASLGPLVRSPRQAKRMLNLYRLVRSTRDLSPAAEFLGSKASAGQFQAVSVLLGLLTTYPRLLGQLISAVPTEDTKGGLGYRPHTALWNEVVEGLRPRAYGERWVNDISDDLSEADRREWSELVQRVSPATALVNLSDLTAFQLWGPRVTRFSFVLSPLAVQDQSLPGPV